VYYRSTMQRDVIRNFGNQAEWRVPFSLLHDQLYCIQTDLDLRPEGWIHNIMVTRMPESDSRPFDTHFLGQMQFDTKNGAVCIDFDSNNFVGEIYQRMDSIGPVVGLFQQSWVTFTEEMKSQNISSVQILVHGRSLPAKGPEDRYFRLKQLLSHLVGEQNGWRILSDGKSETDELGVAGFVMQRV